MNNDTLIYNAEAISTLADTTESHLREFNDAVDRMFHIIDIQMNQSDHWSGQTYEDFKSKCDNFRASRIETMASNLNAYVSHFRKTSTEATSTTSKVQGIVQRDAINNANITGGGNI